MTEYVLEPPTTASIAVTNSAARFPVRRIFCVGRNYAAHAREMGKDPDREPPFFFTKPADAVVDDNAVVAYPPLTNNLHYEAELVVAMGSGGVNIDEQDALDHVFGYAIGNELTRRDLQLAARDHRAALGLGQGFRPFGGVRAGASAFRGWAPAAGIDPAERSTARPASRPTCRI